MSNSIILRNGTIVNEFKTFEGDLWIKNGRIEKIASQISLNEAAEEIDCSGKIIMPGVIDDQVHFREPGLTHKANIASESHAAVLGGTTTFMEMPNTVPSVFTIDLLEQKYEIAQKTSKANYSFFLGASNDNIEEIKKIDIKNICGLKIFMGSSTGNLLVDSETALHEIFKNAPTIIATHCEEESIVLARKAQFKEEAERRKDPAMHPIIRNHEACIVSSKKAIEIAKKYDARLHILHISTADEVLLFDPTTPLARKRITSEACVHHLWFNDQDYAKYGNQIVCNPAIKTQKDQEAIWNGLLNNYIDIIATDHAPHTIEEKNVPYPGCPSGVPLIQHSLLMMLEKINSRFTLEQLVHKMCHAPAICFQIKERGFLREGYFADIAIINPSEETKVLKDNLAYHCGWSPFEGHTFKNNIEYTIINGAIAQKFGKMCEKNHGARVSFSRD
jgi:dihydroorotase